MADSDDPLLGRVVDGRYRIDGVIGRGGMGAVYRARQLGIERDVAFKVLRTDRRRPAETRRFEAEARIIARLRHPHTVRLIDFGTLDDDLYLVLELVGGTSLKERIVDGTLSPALALELCAQVADALTEAHGLGIVHRDLKPANIVVERVGDREVARILDFGVAHADGGGMTRTGAVIGTPAYMAPEQVRAQPVSPATDLYALGVTLFEALAGMRPFKAQGSYALMMKHVEAAPLPLEPLLPAGDPWPEVAALVARLMAKDPAERPPSAGVVRDTLRGLAARLPRTVVAADATLAPPDDASWDDSWSRSASAAASSAGSGESSGVTGESFGAMHESSGAMHESSGAMGEPPGAMGESFDAPMPSGAMGAPVVASGHPARSASDIPGPLAPAERPRRPWALLAAGVAVALLGGAIGWTVLAPDAPPAATVTAGSSAVADEAAAVIDAGRADARPEPAGEAPVAAPPSDPDAAADTDTDTDGEARRGRITL